MDVWYGREIMLEKRFTAVPPQAFTADGTTDGKITVFDSSLFKVKQVVTLTGNTLQPLELEIKRITDIHTMYVGPIKGNIDTREDVSAYTVALAGSVFANEQKRPSIDLPEYSRAVYEEEPVVATRVIPVDRLGNKITDENPTPVKTGTWWDEADISRDGDDDITKVEFSKFGSLVETIDLQYNGEKSVVKVIKS